jgi:hypothetical protein
MGYKFGDFLLKPALRALTNNPSYEFGDLSRGAIASLHHSIESLQQGSLSSAFRDFRIQGQSRRERTRFAARRALVSGQRGQSADLVVEDLHLGLDYTEADELSEPSRSVTRASPPSEQELWGMFFQRCMDAAVAGCSRGEISIEDLLDAEPFLMIGLPSVALFEAVMRTADASSTGLLLSSGRALQPSDVPPSFTELFGILMHTANKVAECTPALSEDERQFVRTFLLVSGADKVVSAEGVAEQRQVELKRIFSHLVSVSTEVTRLGFYKQNFADVLEAATHAVQDCCESQASSSSPTSNYGYVVLGAGPVGLWTAVQIKLRLPSESVVVYEKRAEYSRQQMIRLDSDAFWWSCGDDEHAVKTLKEIQNEGRGVKLKDLETSLRELAMSLGVDFVTRTIVNGEELFGLHPEAKAIIGADGRHSVFRDTVFKPRFARKASSFDPAAIVDGAALTLGGVLGGVSKGLGSTVSSVGVTLSRVISTASSTETDTATADVIRNDPTADDEFIDVHLLQHTVYINFELPERFQDDSGLKAGALQALAYSSADSILHGGRCRPRRISGMRPE